MRMENPGHEDRTGGIAAPAPQSSVLSPQHSLRVGAMFDGIAARYDLMNRLMSAGQDVRWRRIAVASLRPLPAGPLLDIGAGTGDLALEMRRGHPGFRGDGVEWFGAPPGCLAFRRTGSTLVCALNASNASVPLPPGDLLLTSGPLDEGLLPPDTAVYLT